MKTKRAQTLDGPGFRWDVKTRTGNRFQENGEDEHWEGVPMNAKGKGSRNERRSRDILEAAGYRVTRAAASLGEWDLVGIGSTDFVLVQCKTRDWPGAVEMEILKSFSVPSNARKLVHRWRDRQRLPDVKEIP